MNKNKKNMDFENKHEVLDDSCENCKSEHESVSQNLILIGYKICESCRISKTIFPIQIELVIGSASILLITKETDKKAIIKKDKKTTPKDLKFDFIFNTCLVAMINEANIHN